MTYQVQVGSQDTVAAALGTVSDWSQAAQSAPAAHLLPGSSLMWHWAWKGYNSKNDVRSRRRCCYSWSRCGRC